MLFQVIKGLLLDTKQYDMTMITDDNTHDEKRLCKSWYIVSDSRSSTARVEVAYL